MGASYDKDPSPYLRQSVAENPYRLLEWTTFLEVLGSVKGLVLLDLACGDGRLTRLLAHRGARGILGIDVSTEMITRAEKQNRIGEPEAFPELIEYRVLSACDNNFQLSSPADAVVAMYLFHYAQSEDELFRMCPFIGRNLRPGGRFVTYTVNPSCDFGSYPEDMEARIGFQYRIVDPPQHTLVIEDFEVPLWQWSTKAHEESLKAAGLDQIAWHPLKFPVGNADLVRQYRWYLDNPSCIVLSATKS